jgi:GTP-binding protein Era
MPDQGKPVSDAEPARAGPAPSRPIGSADGDRAGIAVIVGRLNVRVDLLNVGWPEGRDRDPAASDHAHPSSIRTLPDAQLVLVDTPGLHQARSLLNRRMVDLARTSLSEGDVAVLVIDASAGFGGGDREIAETLAATKAPAVVVLNKIDRIAKSNLLPLMAALAAILPGAEIVPASAKTGAELQTVLDIVVRLLPEGPSLYPDDDVTTETERMLVQELVREQIFLARAGAGSVAWSSGFTEAPAKLTVVKATILVDREPQADRARRGGSGQNDRYHRAAGDRAPARRPS